MILLTYQGGACVRSRLYICAPLTTHGCQWWLKMIPATLLLLLMLYWLRIVLSVHREISSSRTHFRRGGPFNYILTTEVTQHHHEHHHLVLFQHFGFCQSKYRLETSAQVCNNLRFSYWLWYFSNFQINWFRWLRWCEKSRKHHHSVELGRWNRSLLLLWLWRL